MKRNLYILLLLVVLVFFGCNQNHSSSEITKIALRDIGNKLLLSYQDSTSLILPVKEISTGKFELSFQSQLAFTPDSLVTYTKESIKKANLPNEYRVEVIQCADEEVAYSYEMKNNQDESIIPCKTRELPLNCYTIQILFIDKEQAFDYGWLVLIILIVLVLALWYRFKTNTKNSLEEPYYYKIGNYKFDKEQSKLLYVETEISLSKKECELLEILCDNLNDVVKRDELSKRVWEDHGVFVGRSLDTYISKLRKKLKEDSTIKITNVHGVGYKLEVSKI